MNVILLAKVANAYASLLVCVLVLSCSLVWSLVKSKSILNNLGVMGSFKQGLFLNELSENLVSLYGNNDHSGSRR